MTDIIEILFRCQNETHFASFHRAAPRENGFNFSAKSSIFVVAKPTKTRLQNLKIEFCKVQRKRLSKDQIVKGVSRKCRAVKRHKMCLVLTLEYSIKF